MLITWARLICRFLRLLFVIEATPDIQVDRNAKCPGCGHRSGSLACVHHDGKVLIEHTCAVCGARFYELAVMQDAQPHIVQAKVLTK